jgi:hypothetical protein
MVYFIIVSFLSLLSKFYALFYSKNRQNTEGALFSRKTYWQN